MPLSDEKIQRNRNIRAMLEEFWPAAFCFYDPRPLKVGILDDMVADASRRALPFDTGMIRLALKVYTCRYVYQRALSKQACRFDLDGNPAGEVSAEQKAHASAQVQRIDQKEKARKAAADAQKAAKGAVSHPDA